MTGIGASGAAIISRRVLVVEDDTLVTLAIRDQLEELGHRIVGEAKDPAEAIVLFDREHPDLVLLDIRLGSMDGIELAGQLQAKKRTAMIVLSAYGDTALINRATAAGVFGYLIKPVSSRGLQAQIQVAAERFAEHDRVLKENATLVQTLEERKLVERAKGILMKRYKLAEADAHKRLQLESQRRRVGLPELARKIIESEELLGGMELG